VFFALWKDADADLPVASVIENLLEFPGGLLRHAQVSSKPYREGTAARIAESLSARLRRLASDH
jgi:hypothetical protein